MDRRAFLNSATFAMLVAPFIATNAQAAGVVYRIGWLTLGPAPAAASPFGGDAFLQALNKLGYVEGETFAIEAKYGDGKQEQLLGLARDLTQFPVDVIVAIATPSALAAKQATNKVPIVIVFVSDPAGRGLVTSLARPGGNVTGVTYLGREVFTKGIDLLREAIPRLSRVTVFINPTDPAQTAIYNDVATAVKPLRVRFHRVGVRNAGDLEGSLAAVLSARPDALLVYPLPIAPADVQRIAEFALTNRLPTMSVSSLYPRAGFMASYGPDSIEQFQRAAVYVDKILKGARPGDLPIEQPTKFEFVINMKTAKALGLTIPQSLLLRADQVIE